MSVRTLFLSAAAIALIAACGGTPAAPTAGQSVVPGRSQAAATGASATQAPATPAAEQTDAPVATAPPVAGNGSVAHVVVGSGPLAGTYDASGAKSDCNISPDGSGATFIDLTKPDGVDSVIFTAGQGGPAPKSFYFQVLFAPFSLNQPNLEISTLDPSAPRGSGNASVEDKGGTIKWTIDGKTADNIPVTATIECGPVDRR